MSAFLQDLAPRPADALLGLMAAFRADPRDGKIDLGVGVYRNEAGETPVLRAVKAAEQKILEDQSTKAYEGPRGNAGFCEAVETLVYGADAPVRRDERVVSFTAPGGCGALFLAITLAARLSVEGRIWVSDPSWPNHANLVGAAGRELKLYPYVDPQDGTVAFSALMDALRSSRPGDILILQGPCHNPTGIDLNVEEWSYLGDFCARQLILPIVDIAYHGFAEGLETDMEGVRAFLNATPAAMLSYSASKNFGLYRERAGCFLLQGETAREAGAAATHVAEIARAAYSMPPAHGAAIVETVLGDATLQADWRSELDEMRTRMKSLRTALAGALNQRLNTDLFNQLTVQNGMFSILPLQGPVTDLLRLQQGIYMPASGRINIAGLSTADIEPLADRIAPYLAQALQT